MFKYPWGNLQGLNLAWFLEKFNELREDWATAEAGIDGALDDEIQKAEDALSDVFDARDAAAASATAAAGSATQAGTSATAAGNSATAAASSATTASTKATQAGNSQTAAANSASQAAGSATNAATSATQASNSATAAGNSATAAAGSATQAGNSATAAAGSATAAATSETNAAASAQEAEDVLDSIPEDYSTLSETATNLKSTFGAFPYSDLINKEKFVETRSGRKVEIYRNKIQITKTGSGSAYLWYSLFPARFVAQSTAYPNTSLMDDDFVPFNPMAGTPYLVRWVKQLPNTTQDNLFIATKDGDGNITWGNLQTASAVYLRITNLVNVLPAILTNGNFALFYRTTNSNYENTIEWYIAVAPTGYTSICNYTETTFTASRNYSVKQFIMIYDRLYRVTQAITSGETLVPNTNIVATTLTQEITSLL